MATRLFLALLALLTGLATPVSAAQARVRAGAESGIEAVELARGGAAVVVRVVAIRAIPYRLAVPAVDLGVTPARQPAVLVPAVRLGVDRARE